MTNSLTFTGHLQTADGPQAVEITIRLLDEPDDTPGPLPGATQHYDLSERGDDAAAAPTGPHVTSINRDRWDNWPLARKYALAIERFSRPRENGEDSAWLVQYYRDLFRRETGRDYDGVALLGDGETLNGADPAAADVAAVEPYLDELIEDGQFVYGHQSKIARILGGENAGAFRSRVLAVEERLAARLRAESEAA